jgi:hypothetical protein
MQFFKDGPDIPDRLLQEHEDGHVVFFCGAGISIPAKLPAFEGLVRGLVEWFGPPSPDVQAAMKAKKYDVAIGLLEARCVDGRKSLRKQLAKLLTPSPNAARSTGTHVSLLKLAKDRDGRIRLVTTNFDHLFEHAICDLGVNVRRTQAPTLPVPKSRWNGLVYLHGLLPNDPGSGELDDLVLSSGDFGRAYLTERWAARFVSELFRNFTVCFVGYSINDPVLRYMTDAIASDRMLNEVPREMFAFAEAGKGKQEQIRREWESKGVTPILYKCHRKHALLHRTLVEWSRTYSDGITGKVRIVSDCARNDPATSNPGDNFAGRWLWAISDSGGLPAREFASRPPTPSLKWLNVLCSMHLQEARHPLGSALEAWIFDRGSFDIKFRDVVPHLAQWLCHHLDDPELLFWVVRNGGAISEEFAQRIHWRLRQLDSQERKENEGEGDQFMENSSAARLRPAMRKLWGLVLSGRVFNPCIANSLWDWRDRFGEHGLTLSLRLRLREFLSPRVQLREPFPLSPELRVGSKTDSINEIASCDVFTAASGVSSCILDEIWHLPAWRDALPRMLNDFTGLLRDAMDLLRELEAANFHCDGSYSRLPSLQQASRHSDPTEWSLLIDLVRDAWVEVEKKSPHDARVYAEQWWLEPYPIFKRLCFFAAQHFGIIPESMALEWLLADDHYWLWSLETESEVLALLRLATKSMKPEEISTLERAILSGPPRFQSSDEGSAGDDREGIEILLRLGSIGGARHQLSLAARDKFKELSSNFPSIQFGEDGSLIQSRDDEVMHLHFRQKKVPRVPREMVAWLSLHPDPPHWNSDDWVQCCREEFRKTAWALRVLAKRDEWPASRWGGALLAWSQEGLRTRSWRCIAPLLANAPDTLLLAVVGDLSWWLRSVVESTDVHQALFVKFCERILRLDLGTQERGSDPLDKAYAHPVGKLTEALLIWWGKSKPKKDQALPAVLVEIFTDLCDTTTEEYWPGRVMLCSRASGLFAVDQKWAENHLLPLFDWEKSGVEARAAWAGYLWSLRLDRSFIEAIKQSALGTPYKYTDLGKDGERFAVWLTIAMLDRGDTFTQIEAKRAMSELPSGGLKHGSRAVEDAFESIAEEQRPEYWKNRVRPFLKEVWPKSKDLASPEVTRSFAGVCILAGQDFPDALEVVKHWLVGFPPVRPFSIVVDLEKSDLCTRFPRPALEFINLVIQENDHLLPRELRTCLDAIKGACPDLESDPRLRRLEDCWKLHGLE